MITPQPDAPVSSSGNDAVADWQEVRRIGHDLNNLLGAVVGYAEMLVEDTPADSPSAPDLRRIHESAQRASALVAALMVHAKKVQGALEGRSPRG